MPLAEFTASNTSASMAVQHQHQINWIASLGLRDRFSSLAAAVRDWFILRLAMENRRSN
jgi:hypothetical protein